MERNAWQGGSPQGRPCLDESGLNDWGGIGQDRASQSHLNRAGQGSAGNTSYISDTERLCTTRMTHHHGLGSRVFEASLWVGGDCTLQAHSSDQELPRTWLPDAQATKQSSVLGMPGLCLAWPDCLDTDS